MGNMKNSEKYEQAFNYFKKSYSAKMGGTQNIILPNGKSKFFDDKEFYSGRGSKYNKSIKHDNLGAIKVTRKQYSEFIQMLKKQEQEIKEQINKKIEATEKYKDFKNRGLYEISKNSWTKHIVLSDEESTNRIFDAKRLAKTLKISISDAELLNSTGKTYVFAKELETNRNIRLYHPDIELNYLSISIEYPSDKEVSDFAKEWQKHEPIKTKTNHFIC